MTASTDNRFIIWLSLLTGAVVILIIGVIVGVAALASDVAQLDEQVTALKFGGKSDGAAAEGGSLALPSASGASPAAFKAQIDGLEITKSGLVVSLTVRFNGPADLLYQPPIVRGAKHTYTLTPDSLKAARFAFLDLTTAGEATARFVFQPAPTPKEALTFVFNPEMPVGNVIAPRLEVPLRGGGE